MTDASQVSAALAADHEPQPVVRIRGVNHFFGTTDARKQVLWDNHLALLPGELVIMTGPSGSGKTTLLTLIGALRGVQEGSAQVLGHELFQASPSDLMVLRRHIGFIFQAHNLFDTLTAYQNVRMTLELVPASQAARHQWATKMLTRLGLGERMHYKPRHLSGGQRQRVAIARALAARPKLILADEPTAALDKVAAREVISILKELARNESCTVLLVTHDSRLIDTADRIVNMLDGRIASEYLVEEVVTICEFLSQCSLFEHISPTLLTAMSERMRKERYLAGTPIVHQGDEGDKFYLVRKGQAEVTRQSNGTLNIVGTIGPGDYFGEAALLTGEPRNATVVARQDTVVYSLLKADFLAAIESGGSFAQQIREAIFKRH